jgi:hypothetical protein
MVCDLIVKEYAVSLKFTFIFIYWNQKFNHS